MPMAHAPTPPPGIAGTQPIGGATAEQTEIERLRKELETVKEEMKKMLKMRDEAAPLLGYMRDKAKEEQSEIIQLAKRSKQQEEEGKPAVTRSTTRTTEGAATGESATRGVKRDNAEDEGEAPEARDRGLGTARPGRRVRAARSASPSVRVGSHGGRSDADGLRNEDYLRLVGPKQFGVKTLDATEKNITYREWARTVKRFIRTWPGAGLAAHRAVEWPEKQGNDAISDDKMMAYIDERIELWEGELWALTLKFCEGHLNKAASNASNGFDAWRKIKWHFEPRLAARASMYMSQCTAMLPAENEKNVAEVLEKLEATAKQYEECRGKPLDPELRMSKTLGVLPRELRSKVRSKITDEEDWDEAILIIMEELQDFNTGRVPVSEGSKPALHNIEPRATMWDYGRCGWQGQGDRQGQGCEREGQCHNQCQGNEECPEGRQEGNEDAHKAIDYIHPKGGGKGKGFGGNCHYCQRPGHRANECHKKTADMKAKGLGREAPGYPGAKGKGKGFEK